MPRHFQLTTREGVCASCKIGIYLSAKDSLIVINNMYPQFCNLPTKFRILALATAMTATLKSMKMYPNVGCAWIALIR